MARVNNFLRVLRTGRFKSGKHDTDLLPASHPLSSKNKEEKSIMDKDDRHILNVAEQMTRLLSSLQSTMRMNKKAKKWK